MGRLKDHLESEKKKINALPKEKRWGYIWDYYWIWIVGVGAALIFLIWFIWHNVTTLQENWIYCAFPNVIAQAGEGSQLQKDFIEYSGFNTKEKNVIFNDNFYFDPTSASGMNNSYYQSFVALIEAGDLDLVTMTREEIEALGSSGRLLDLKNELSAPIYEKYKDRLVYSIPYDTEYSTDPVPVGIDVSDSLLMTKYKIYDKSCVLSIGSYTKHIDAVELFLDFILQDVSGPVEASILMAETETEAE